MKKLMIYAVIWFILVSLTMLLPGAKAEENKKIVDTEFVAVSSYLVLMTIFDVETTFSAIRNGAQEANPMMKPFAKNRAYMWGVQLGVDALVIYLAYKMKGDETWRPAWWIAPSFIGTSHAICGGLNLRYVW